MPWTIVTDGEQVCVHKEKPDGSPGERVACHDTEAAAQQQVAALYASEQKALKYKRSAGVIKATQTGFEGYLLRYASPDDRDLDGEWFSPKTYLMREAGYPVKGAPVNFHHGLNKAFDALGIGLFDFADEDDIGLAVRAVLKERDEYVAMLKEIGRVKGLNITDQQLQRKADLAHKAVHELVTTVPLQMSGGYDLATWQVDETTQHIDRAGVVHGALTHQPTDNDNPVVAFKSLRDALHLESDRTTFHMPNPAGDKGPGEGGKGHKADGLVSEDQTSEDTMSPEEIVEIARAAVAEYMEEMKQAAEDEGAPMDDEQLEAVSAEMEDDLKADMGDEEEPPAKVDDERLEKAFIRAMTTYEQTKRDRRSSARKTLSKALDEATRLDTAPSKAGGKSRITVSEPRKYAHLSAPEMALGVMMRTAPLKSQGIPVQLGQLFSMDYLRTMVNKMHQYADSAPYGKTASHPTQIQQATKANVFIKSIIPFKANELDASNITGQGDEWSGEFWSTDLWQRERYDRHYDRMVQKGMWVETIEQGFETAYFPTEGADPTAYTAPQAANVDATGRPETTIKINPFATGRVSITPKEIKIATSHTTIMEEDSVIGVVQTVNRQLNEAALETRDKLMVNGDDTTGTTNINYDGSTPPTGLQTPYYIASDGFRVTALAAGLDASNTLTLNQYRLTLAALDGELRQYYERMCFMIDPTTEMASLALPEIATEDVRRTNATIQSGRILNVYGVDVLSNGFLPQTDTDGKVTGTGNVANRGTIMLVYAPYWGVGYKRQITLETARDIYSGTNVYVMSMRIGFVPRGSNAAVLSYNVATAVS